jgi:hypothetical protein
MGKESDEVKKRIEEVAVGWVSGWSVLEDQFGSNSFRARGSITAPERMWEPTSGEVSFW